MKKEEQIDEMINEGLGGGQIKDKHDKKQLENPLPKKVNEENEQKKDNTMTRNLDDIKVLGKEMEQMKTETEIKKEGKIPSPKEK